MPQGSSEGLVSMVKVGTATLLTGLSSKVEFLNKILS